MGREIKRVALDFAFPPGETWTGYLCPHYRERVTCPTCGGDGRSAACKLLQALWYEHMHGEALDILARDMGSMSPLPAALVDFAHAVLGHAAVRARIERHRGGWGFNLHQCDVDALIAADRLWDFTRVPRTDADREVMRAKVAAGGNSWLPTNNGYIPTAAEVNAWSARGFGHDSINAWICIRARAAAYKADTTCPAECHDGSVPDADLEARIEAWKPTEPPSGDGWQLWQTVSEGGPVSPVFPTPEELARWIVSPGEEWGREPQMEYEAALRWVTGPGWAPSFVGGPAGLTSGIEAMARDDAP